MTEISQKNVFLGGEGDCWWSRNRQKIKALDYAEPVIAAINGAGIIPRKILEIGCSNGWRLDRMARKYDARAAGIEPSAQAVSDACLHFPTLEIVQGTADNLPFTDGRFDLVVYGFCLYLCDRSDLFRIAAEGDRVLTDGGYLVVYDFRVTRPYRRAYQPDPRLFSYKMDHAALFLANPAYSLIQLDTFGTAGEVPLSEDDTVAVAVLKKNFRDAFPLRAD